MIHQVNYRKFVRNGNSNMARSIFHLLNVLKSWLVIFLTARSYYSHFNLQLYVLFQWLCSSTICWSLYDRIFGYSIKLRAEYSNSKLFELTRPRWIRVSECKFQLVNEYFFSTVRIKIFFILWHCSVLRWSKNDRLVWNIHELENCWCSWITQNCLRGHWGPVDQ